MRGHKKEYSLYAFDNVANYGRPLRNTRNVVSQKNAAPVFLKDLVFPVFGNLPSFILTTDVSSLFDLLSNISFFKLPVFPISLTIYKLSCKLVYDSIDTTYVNM